MKKLDRYDVWASFDVWPTLAREKRDSGQWCESEDVQELEAENEQLRTLLQRVVDEKRTRRVQSYQNSHWLATSHNGDMYAEESVIDSFLLNAIKQALNPDWEPR